MHFLEETKKRTKIIIIMILNSNSHNIFPFFCRSNNFFLFYSTFFLLFMCFSSFFSFIFPKYKINFPFFFDFSFFLYIFYIKRIHIFGSLFYTVCMCIYIYRHTIVPTVEYKQHVAQQHNIAYCSIIIIHIIVPTLCVFLYTKNKKNKKVE